MSGEMTLPFVQGAAVGAMMLGIPVPDGQFTGGVFDWLTPFPILTGVGAGPQAAAVPNLSVNMQGKRELKFAW